MNEQRKLLRRALRFAEKKHKGQIFNRDKYIIHCMEVAQLVETLVPDDTNLTIAGYLHDVLEITDTSVDQLRREFDDDVVSLVREVTKTSDNTYPELKTRRGAILKYVDRITELVSMDEWEEHRQKDLLKKSKFWKS